MQKLLEVLDQHIQSGATASDNYDGDITADIVTGKQCRHISTVLEVIQ